MDVLSIGIFLYDDRQFYEELAVGRGGYLCNRSSGRALLTVGGLLMFSIRIHTTGSAMMAIFEEYRLRGFTVGLGPRLLKVS